MVKKRVTYNFVFEYDEDEVDDFSDEGVEKLAFGQLAANLTELARGNVELVED